MSLDMIDLRFHDVGIISRPLNATVPLRPLGTQEKISSPLQIGRDTPSEAEASENG
jgi:hypothetical protein